MISLIETCKRIEIGYRYSDIWRCCDCVNSVLDRFSKCVMVIEVLIVRKKKFNSKEIYIYI